MARLQILELPAEHHGDDTVTPFVLVIDQAGEETVDTLSAPEASGSPYETAIARLTSLTLAEQIGARAVLVFRETVDIPAGEAGAHAEPLLRVSDFTDPDEVGRLVKERDEARQWTRHGYEIGQRHCGWTDHGVAPAWLTEGWPPHFDSCEHLKRAGDMDGQISRVRAAIEERRNEVAEFEAENEPSGWSDAVTVTCDRIADALRVFPPPGFVREPDGPEEKPAP